MLPKSFTVNNSGDRTRTAYDITFNSVLVDEHAALYKREADNVKQFGFNSLKASDKWAVKYYVTSDRKRNRYFTSKGKAAAFLAKLTNNLR